MIKNKPASFKIAVFWLTTLSFLAILGPIFFENQAQLMDFTTILEAPSRTHYFGTDALGRDLLTRLALGTRISFGVAVMAVGMALLLGLVFGAIAGYYGGFLDRLIMSFVDLMLCFPTFFLILAVIAILGPSVTHILIIIGATSWMQTARLVRAEVMSLKEREFIQAARALGASDGRILLRHLVPNAMGPVIVSGVLGISSAILIESGLSFLGIGVQPPTPSWGNILMEGKSSLGAAWWMTFFPGIMIFTTVFSANVLGEHLGERSLLKKR